MLNHSHELPLYQQFSSSQNDSHNQQTQPISDQNQYENQEIQIQLDYQQLLKNRTIKDKKSNVLIRLAPEQPSIKKKQKKVRPKKKIQRFQQIDVKDITDIVVIALLILILGISLFRVVMEVQIQFKNAQQQLPGINKCLNGISEQSSHSQNSSNNGQHLNAQPIKPKTLLNPISLSKQCINDIDIILKEHGRLYDFKYPDNEMKIKSKLNVFAQNKNILINKQKFSQAVTLLRAVHHINPDGTLLISGDSCESDTSKKQKLEQALSQQFNRWNTQYQIDAYHSKQLLFCIVVNSYNNAQSGLMYRNIDSILQQNYTNYHIVYTDDASPDQTGKKVLDYLKLKKFPSSKYNLTINPTKNGMMQNIYVAVQNGCKDGQIVVMLDGDDSFIGVNVLSLLNAVYHKYNIALLWTNFISIYNNNQASMGFSRDYSQKQKADSSFRKMKGFISSHLKTFFVDLFKKIKPEDLQHNNGKFFGGASDTAMMITMIELANPRIKYLPQLVYEYRYDTGQTGNVVNKGPQKQALAKIFSTKQYKKLQDFSFIEKAIEAALVITPVERAKLKMEDIEASSKQMKQSAQNIIQEKQKA